MVAIKNHIHFCILLIIISSLLGTACDNGKESETKNNSSEISISPPASNINNLPVKDVIKLIIDLPYDEQATQFNKQFIAADSNAQRKDDLKNALITAMAELDIKDFSNGWQRHSAYRVAGVISTSTKWFGQDFDWAHEKFSLPNCSVNVTLPLALAEFQKLTEKKPIKEVRFLQDVNSALRERLGDAVWITYRDEKLLSALIPFMTGRTIKDQQVYAEFALNYKLNDVLNYASKNAKDLLPDFFTYLVDIDKGAFFHLTLRWLLENPNSDNVEAFSLIVTTHPDYQAALKNEIFYQALFNDINTEVRPKAPLPATATGGEIGRKPYYELKSFTMVVDNLKKFGLSAEGDDFKPIFADHGTLIWALVHKIKQENERKVKAAPNENIYTIVEPIEKLRLEALVHTIASKLKPQIKETWKTYAAKPGSDNKTPAQLLMELDPKSRPTDDYNAKAWLNAQ